MGKVARFLSNLRTLVFLAPEFLSDVIHIPSHGARIMLEDRAEIERSGTMHKRKRQAAHKNFLRRILLFFLILFSEKTIFNDIKDKAKYKFESKEKNYEIAL